MLSPALQEPDLSAANGVSRRRWVVLGLLFAITVINFIDRQTLSILAPKLKQMFSFTSTDYGRIVAAFQFGMTMMEVPMGMLMDRFGTRLVFSLAVVWWSIATGMHAIGRSVGTFALFRFWMGTGESANFSGAVKVVNRWFPRHERALAIGVFNGGTMAGSIIAPPLIVFLDHSFGWKIAFLVPAAFGVLWVLSWRRLYTMSAQAERDQPDGAAEVPATLDLIRTRQAWGLMLCRFFAGPVLQFYWYWMPDYLYTVRKMSLLEIGAFSWVPFLLGDAGSVAGGWAAARLLQRGVSIANTRRITMLIGAVCCLGSLGVVVAPNAVWAILVIGLVLFGATFFAANMFAAVGDLFPTSAAGRVTGLTGLTGGVGGILFPLLTGFLVDHYSYAPAFVIAALMPFAGGITLFLLAPGLKPAQCR
jgi:MFS transporter, ACS family, hexuronate transporter